MPVRFSTAAVSSINSSSGLAHETPFFGYVLMGVSRLWRNVLEAQLAQQGLTDATWAPLFHLYAAVQPLSLKQLAQRLTLDSSSLVRVVDLLEARQWVQRVPDLQDRRSKLLRLTSQGLDAVADVIAKLQHVEAQLLQGMEAQTVDVLRQGMVQLQERLAQIQCCDRTAQ